MKRLLAAVAALVVTGAVLFVVPSDHYLFLPDAGRPLDPLVRVEGEEEPDGEAATGAEGIYMVDILVRRASLLERIVPEIREGASLQPPHAVNPVGVSDRERREMSLNQMSRSQQVAVAVALESLGHDVDVRRTGVEVTTVLPDTPADGTLKVGDVIVSAAGERVESRDELLRVMDDVTPGDEVAATVRRDGQRVDLRLGTQPAHDDANRAVFGVIVDQAAEFEFPIEVEIDAGNVGGPSAGLAFALQVVEELEGNVTQGRRVAVTGELDLNGNVGRVGGVHQKTLGAQEAGAEIFVVPGGNAEEARAHADDIEIVPVSTFRQALAYLTGD